MNFLRFVIDSFPRYMSNERGTWFAAGVTAVALSAASGAYSAYSSMQQGAAQKKFADYQAQQEQVDAQQAYAVGQAQSQQVAQQGELNSQTLAFKNAQEIGAQRTAESANGISANSVTAENLEIGSFNKGNRDEQMLNYNEQNQEWSIKTSAADQAFTDTQQANLDVIQGKNEQQAGEIAAAGTLLSTAATTAKAAYGMGTTPSVTGQGIGAAPGQTAVLP
jgi:hypothetical protein